MPGHGVDCVQDERIRALTQRVDRLEVTVDSTKEDVKAIKEDVKAIRDFQTKVMWTALCGFLSSAATLIVSLLNK